MTVFLSILNQLEIHLVQNGFSIIKNMDPIPFNLKGNMNFLSVCVRHQEPNHLCRGGGERQLPPGAEGVRVGVPGPFGGPQGAGGQQGGPGEQRCTSIY